MFEEEVGVVCCRCFFGVKGEVLGGLFFFRWFFFGSWFWFYVWSSFLNWEIVF